MKTELVTPTNNLILGVLIVLVSVALRFYHLTTLSLWTDELFSLATVTLVGGDTPWYLYARKSLSALRLEDSFLTWKAAEHSPPLFEALLWVWVKLFGNSDFAVRSLSATLGSFAPLIMFLGLRKSLGTYAAVVGGLTLAVMPAAVLYAQELRTYSLLITLSTLATVRLIEHLCQSHSPTYQPDSSWWTHYSVDIVIYTLMSYAHYTGFILAFAYSAIRVASAFIGRRKEFYLINFLWVPVALAPWIYLNSHTLALTNNGAMGWRSYVISDIWELMIPAISTFFIPGKYSLMVSGLAFTAIGYFGVRGASAQTKSSTAWFRDIRTMIISAFLFVLALQLAHSAYTAFNARVWHWRYFSVSIPICAAFFALLASQAGRYKWLTSILMAALVIICLQELSVRYKTDMKEDYRGAAQYIVRRSHDKPLVVVTGHGNKTYYLHYLKKLMSEAKIEFDFQSIESSTDLSELCASAAQTKSRQVFIFYHISHKTIAEPLRSMCVEALKFRSEESFFGLFVTEYETSAE